MSLLTTIGIVVGSVLLLLFVLVFLLIVLPEALDHAKRSEYNYKHKDYEYGKKYDNWFFFPYNYFYHWVWKAKLKSVVNAKSKLTRAERNKNKFLNDKPKVDQTSDSVYAGKTMARARKNASGKNFDLSSISIEKYWEK